MSDIIGAAVQGGTGIGQIVGGMIINDETQEKIKELREKYPEMDIPTAITMATELARQDAQSTRLPGQDLYESQIQQSTAQGMSAARESATSAADLLGNTTSLYGQQSNAMTNLQIEAARQQAANRQRYGQQLNTLGQWQQQQYYMNEYYPWVSEMNRLEGISQSAYDMTIGGINTLAASGANLSGGSTMSNTQSGSMGNTQAAPQYSWAGMQQDPYQTQNMSGYMDNTQMPAESQGTPILINQNSNNMNWNTSLPY